MLRSGAIYGSPALSQVSTNKYKCLRIAIENSSRTEKQNITHKIHFFLVGPNKGVLLMVATVFITYSNNFQ
jgi:hypothetical protein